MKVSSILATLGSFAAIVMALPAPQFPMCTFNPATGHYECPGVPPIPPVTPPICKFDPIKGEYVCPPPAVSEATTSTEAGADLTDVAINKCTVEGLHKCTRERQGTVCKFGQWEIVHRCTAGQQCDMKEGNFCRRTQGPGSAARAQACAEVA